nr:putative reverse transcriptase domain-containing protein [Tanacetum cinerariifolium]
MTIEEACKEDEDDIIGSSMKVKEACKEDEDDVLGSSIEVKEIVQVLAHDYAMIKVQAKKCYVNVDCIMGKSYWFISLLKCMRMGQNGVSGKPRKHRVPKVRFSDQKGVLCICSAGSGSVGPIRRIQGVVHFGKKDKLAPRYVGPFEIIERIGLVAYRLRLPQDLSDVHDTFHVSNLKMCLVDANLHVPLEEFKVDKSLRFVEEPLKIIDREVKS